MPASPASRMLLGGLLALLAALAAPAASQAAFIVFGSPLSAPATLNTAENLAYPGVNTAVPGAIVHTYHFGADTALWNVSAGRSPAHSASAATMGVSAPAAGQAVKISLEGCAEPASGGPAPLTQIHFQDISPLPGGGAQVNLTSQPFEIPVCGENADGSTITTYEPINLCVNKGDYVDFNDEGGFVEPWYRSGVPYRVLGAVQGAVVDSFIKGGGTDNGAVMSPSYSSAMEGFASSQNEELMLQVTMGTGPDARYVCPGGSKDAPPVLPSLRVGAQTDGINRARIVEVAVYCRPASGCSGTAKLTAAIGRGRYGEVGHTTFDLPGNNTTRVAIRVSPTLLKLIRKRHGVRTMFAAELDGQTFSGPVTIKIL